MIASTPAQSRRRSPGAHPSRGRQSPPDRAPVRGGPSGCGHISAWPDSPRASSAERGVVTISSKRRSVSTTTLVNAAFRFGSVAARACCSSDSARRIPPRPGRSLLFFNALDGLVEGDGLHRRRDLSEGGCCQDEQNHHGPAKAGHYGCPCVSPSPRQKTTHAPPRHAALFQVQLCE